jgi:hypothetical protein
MFSYETCVTGRRCDYGDVLFYALLDCISVYSVQGSGYMAGQQHPFHSLFFFFFHFLLLLLLFFLVLSFLYTHACIQQNRRSPHSLFLMPAVCV